MVPRDANERRPAKTLRHHARWLAKTPLHPQWHLWSRRVDPAVSNCCGLVLDIGSANGWLRSFLSPSAAYVGLDYPVTAVGLYHTRPDIFGDAASLPFASGSFDSVACYEVLEHVLEPEAVLAEIARVLAPGGVSELSMPFLYPVHDAPHDYQRWTRYGWEHSAAKAGLALAAPLQHAVALRKALLLPVAALAILVVNLLSWVGVRVWPEWPGMTTGHRVLLRKPS